MHVQLTDELTVMNNLQFSQQKNKIIIIINNHKDLCSSGLLN